MFKKRSLKVTAVALASFVSLGVFGAAASEASPFHSGHDYEITQLAHKHHSDHPKKYSEGDRNTAAIAGAVAGYFIAKNT